MCYAGQQFDANGNPLPGTDGQANGENSISVPGSDADGFLHQYRTAISEHFDVSHFRINELSLCQ